MAVNNVGFSTQTIADASAGLTVPARAHGVVIVVSTAPVAYRDDGAAAVAAAGSSTYLNIGDVLTFDSWTAPGNNWRSVLNALRFIRTAGTSSILACSWYD